MSLELLRVGDLTPQQVLAACMNDDLEDIEAVIVIRITKADKLYLISNSKCTTSQMALAAHLLSNQTVMETLA